MHLFLLRHAPAAPRDPAGCGDDSIRPLTSAGIAKMKRLARAMRGMKLKFDLILSSPCQRARQTAEVVAAEFKPERGVKFTRHLAPGGDPKRLVNRFPIRYRRSGSVLLVGHEPELGRLAGLLVAGQENTGLKLKKGGLCKLTAQRLRPGPCAELKWLLTPRLLLGRGPAFTRRRAAP